MNTDQASIYRQDLQALLQNLAMWSGARASEWTDDWLERMQDLPFSHNPPEYYIAPILIPEVVQAEIGISRQQELEGYICIEIGYGQRAHYSQPGYDWSLARQRIAEIVNRYTEMPL